MNSQRSGFILVLLVIVGVLALTATGGYIYFSRISNTPVATTAKDTTPSTYQNSTDLNAADQELDNTDINGGLDASLKQLDSDSSEF